eukprot:gene15359-biopygen3231
MLPALSFLSLIGTAIRTAARPAAEILIGSPESLKTPPIPRPVATERLADPPNVSRRTDPFHFRTAVLVGQEVDLPGRLDEVHGGFSCRWLQGGPSCRWRHGGFGCRWRAE